MNKIKFFKIITTDYLSAVCLVFSLIFILLGPGVLLVWLFTIPTILMRYSLIKKTLTKGKTAKAIIVKRWFFRQGAKLQYAFKDSNEQKHLVGNFVAKTILKYQIGDTVEVAYLPKNPKKAFIIDLYLSK